MGRPQEAKVAALTALELTRRMKTPAYEAEALANLGGAERDLGEVDSAIADQPHGPPLDGLVLILLGLHPPPQLR